MYHMFLEAHAKTFGRAALVLAASALCPQGASASELLMFERAGCVWCQRWDREVAPVYGKTAEARMLPLRRIDVERQKATGVTLAAPVRYTPTFVVVNDSGQEVGRITGYSNDDMFWGLLGKLAARLKPPPPERKRI